MPRNYHTITGNVLIDSVARQKDVSIYDMSIASTPTLLGTTTSDPTSGAYSVEVLKERNSYLMGIADTKYGRSWKNDTAYSVGDKVLTPANNSHWYECTVAGTSGSSEPSWSTSGSTFTDNTVTWLDKGLTETPIARGPFIVIEPAVDSDVLNLVRYQELSPVNEVDGSAPTSVGGAPILDTVTKKWGKSSIKFDGVDDYYRYPSITFSGDFTIDVWVMFHQLPTDFTRPFIFIGEVASNLNRIQMALRTDSTVDIYAEVNGSPGSFPLTGLVSTDTWYLFSFERYGTAYSLFQNGSLINSVSYDLNIVPSASAYTYIARGRAGGGDRYCPCFIGEHRISNVARYGGTSFTAPTSPWTL